MRTVRVVFATDNPTLGQATVAALAAESIVVTVHENLLGLYSLLLREQPDVILLEGDMPQLALEAAAKFLRTKESERRFPIVLYTSTAEHAPDPAQLAVACLADDFVDKAAGARALARAVLRVALRCATSLSSPPWSSSITPSPQPASTHV